MITVIFSSFNGEKTVRRTLQAFQGLSTPPGGWKLIAVDNGSMDSTLQILRSFEGILPLKVLEVPERGKNNALNAALKHIEGELVIFTDDDVIPDSQWLCNFKQCTDRNPEFGLFGGAITPLWPIPPDDWILRDIPLGMVFAITPPEQSEGPISNDLVWGPNMAVRKVILDSGVEFQTLIGPDGTSSYMMGSETEFTRRLGTLGVKAWFCAGATVQHIIRRNQMSKAWVLQRFFRHGRATYHFERSQYVDSLKIFGVDRWLLRRIVELYLKRGLLYLTGRHEKVFLCSLSIQHTKGRIHQSKLYSAHKK